MDARPRLASRRAILASLSALATQLASGRARAQPRSALGRTWDPARTLALVVGVLEWQASETFTPFPTEGRRDEALVEALRRRGVPRDRVVFLSDREATLARIHAALDALLSAAGPSDLAWVYFGGHGVRDDAGETWFVPWDADPARLSGTAWSARSLFDALAARFRGAGVILTADCCHSGALAEEALARGASVPPCAALASSLANESSTGRWTFTDCLVSALDGEGVVDSDGDGTVTLEDVARHAEGELAFVEQQLSAFHATASFPRGFSLGAVRSPSPPRWQERIEARWRGRWYPARILAEERTRVRVHYAGFEDSWDEWVPCGRVRPYAPALYPPGARVEVKWHGRWYRARVLEARLGLHRVHYDDYESTWDEWVGGDRVRALPPRARRG